MEKVQLRTSKWQNSLLGCLHRSWSTVTRQTGNSPFRKQVRPAGGGLTEGAGEPRWVGGLECTMAVLGGLWEGDPQGRPGHKVAKGPRVLG